MYNAKKNTYVTVEFTVLDWVSGDLADCKSRERLKFTCALLKDSPVILLDEATASLDAENETHISALFPALSRAKQYSSSPTACARWRTRISSFY